MSASRQLPEGWAWATLDEFTQGRGQSLDPSRHKAETFELYSIPGFDAGAPELLNGSAIGSAKQMVNAGDVLLSKINPRINRVWLVGEDRGFRQIASTEWIVFPRNDYINGDYLKFFLRQHHVRNFLASNVSGVGGSLMRIKASTLDGYPIPVAPRDEQRRIVEKIETLFAELDKGEESLRQVQTLLARYRQSVLKAAVTGELTADWRARHAGKLEHGRDLLARILKARRENWQGRGKYKEPVEPDTANLLELPDGWVWASLSQITWIKGGITVDKKRNPTNPITLPYLRVANVQNGYLDLSHVREITVEAEKAEECLLKPGDILLNEGGDRDKLGRGWVWSGEIERCIHQNHVFRARPVLAELSSKFVSFYANAFGQPFFMQKGKQSVNLASISLTAISGLPIPLPPVEEQREIVELLEDKLGEIGQLEKACEHELSRSSALRRSVLRHAFAGKLVPQDLNDEPASKLLERIRSQRETANCKTTREAVTA